MASENEFAPPKFSDDHLLENLEPGPLTKTFRAYLEGGRQAMAAQIAEAQDNLARAMEAYDREGEPGLQREMQRIHPDDPNRLETPIGTLVYQKGGSLQPDGKGQMHWVPDSLREMLNDDHLRENPQANLEAMEMLWRGTPQPSPPESAPPKNEPPSSDLSLETKPVEP